MWQNLNVCVVCVLSMTREIFKEYGLSIFEFKDETLGKSTTMYCISTIPSGSDNVTLTKSQYVRVLMSLLRNMIQSNRDGLVHSE